MTPANDSMRIDWDVAVEADDGLVLRADVFRPAHGRHPVLLSYSPYGKGLNFAEGRPDQWEALCREHPDVPAGSSNVYANWEAVDPEKWVPHGYVVVRVDSRGMGRSPGYVDHFSARETQDLYDCIEWAGTQPWSSGRVGLVGISYLAMNQWQVAALQPPHLAAICPWEGCSDNYRDGRRHGGILSTFTMRWYRNRIGKAQYGIGEHGQRNPVTGVLAFGDETLSEEQRARQRADLIAEHYDHPTLNAYYEERNGDLPAIRVPLLSAGNLGGQGLHLRGNVEGFVRAGSDHKWLELHTLEHWTHFYTDYGRELQKRFFDHFLKDERNGWDRVPPVIVNVRHVDGTTALRYEDDWPLPQTRWTKLYLHPSDGALGTTPPAGDGHASYQAMRDGITFRTVVDEETEITGPSAAKLFVSSATTDVDLFLVLRVFDPAGNEVTMRGANNPHMPISQGWLRGSHRKLDPELSTAHQPVHTHDDPQPLNPGEVYELDVEIWPTSIVVPAGYTLALTVQGHDYTCENADAAALVDWHNPAEGSHNDPRDRPSDVFAGKVMLHAGDHHRPYLLLPVVPPDPGKADGTPQD
ncbi:CocE/NonD family hydrolase [Amycolatopsis jejuensis]|uniref:CocE/NonD family hydrolase n=1 Tax=Amycolatopsis jejuensis TaxID=330084 RepID=UPI000ACDC59B|nr:CocE/NonD family hydrolase [Amycolatopsis jejuensis]